MTAIITIAPPTNTSGGGSSSKAIHTQSGASGASSAPISAVCAAGINTRADDEQRQSQGHLEESEQRQIDQVLSARPPRDAPRAG